MCWWCSEKKSPKVCFHKCKLILPKIQSMEFHFFHILLPTSCVSKWYQWLRIWLFRNIRFVSVNISMSARNRPFLTNYWHITIWSLCRYYSTGLWELLWAITVNLLHCYRNWYQYWGHCCLINDLGSPPQPESKARGLWWASQVVNETTMTEIEVSISILSWWN